MKNIIFHGSDLENIAAQYHIAPESITNFAANVNPLGLSEYVKLQIASHLDVVATYPDRNYHSLRHTIGTYCDVESDHILVGNGTSELISLLIQVVNPKRTLILGPTYSEYARELSFTGSSIEYFALSEDNQFRLHLYELQQRLEQGYDLFVICNPNNPTSSVLTTQEMAEVFSLCRKHNTFVLVDETYIEFTSEVTEYTATSLVTRFDNFVLLRGLSKFFAAPGLRLGYGISGNTQILEQMKKRQILWSLNSIGAFAGELLLQDQDFILKTKSLIQEERSWMLGELVQIDGIKTYPTHANFILLQLVDTITATSLFDACMKEKLMIRDCSSFTQLHGEYVRFCIMNKAENQKLLNTIRNAIRTFI